MPGKLGIPPATFEFPARYVPCYALALLAVTSGCLGSFPPGDDRGNGSIPSTTTADGPEKSGGHPALDGVLYGLTTAENRTEYATAHDLSLREDRVEVVIELREGRAVPAGFDLRVTARHDRLVQAFGRIDDLRALADHANVSYVRPPRNAVSDTETESYQP